MGKSDLFRRTLEAGTAVLGMSRERAEAVVKEWVEAGDLGKGKAQKAIDDVLERSRRATEDLRDMIRREIREQLGGMGVATRDDVARLEAKIDALKPVGPEPRPRAPRPVRPTTPKAAKAASATKVTSMGGAASTQKVASTAKAARAAPIRKASTAKKAPGATSGPGDGSGP